MTDNPKRAFGLKKPSIWCIPRTVIYELGLAMYEGACKYGAFNWRDSEVVASDYISALDRHVSAWIEGEDLDPDSKLSHITKAIATLVVMRDAMMSKKFVDDRPPKAPPNWMTVMTHKHFALREKCPNPVEPFTEAGKQHGEKE